MAITTICSGLDPRLAVIDYLGAALRGGDFWTGRDAIVVTRCKSQKRGTLFTIIFSPNMTEFGENIWDFLLSLSFGVKDILNIQMLELSNSMHADPPNSLSLDLELKTDLTLEEVELNLSLIVFLLKISRSKI